MLGKKLELLRISQEAEASVCTVHVAKVELSATQSPRDSGAFQLFHAFTHHMGSIVAHSIC